MISITLPDGSVQEGQKGLTTPHDVAMLIHKRLAETAVVAKVDDTLWDLNRPLEGDCKLKLLKFDDEEARQVRT